MLVFGSNINSTLRYLAEQIWKSLPDIEKIILDNQPPLLFDDTNREFLLKSLQYCNWPISKQDIELVEKEINLAQTYIRLCKELNYYILHKTELDKETVSLVEDKIQLDKEPIEPVCLIFWIFCLFILFLIFIYDKNLAQSPRGSYYEPFLGRFFRRRHLFE